MLSPDSPVQQAVRIFFEHFQIHKENGTATRDQQTTGLAGQSTEHRNIPKSSGKASTQSTQSLSCVTRQDGCWVNATLQAVLNLNIVSNKLFDQPPECLAQLSSTPGFANALLRTVHEAGREFKDQPRVSTELCREIRSKHADPVELVDHLLGWLNNCDVQSHLQVKEVTKCYNCGVAAAAGNADLGAVVTPSVPLQDESIASLVNRTIFVKSHLKPCHKCNTMVETNSFSSSPDVFTLHLPRTVDMMSPPRSDLIPSKFMEVPLSENRRQFYHLSSVLCHRESTAKRGQFWSYLFKGQTTIKADDTDTLVEVEQFPHDIQKNGIIYFYERLK